jgi:hypothetical protein
MSASNRGFRGRSTACLEGKSLAQENIGNRKTFEDIKIPPDNVGNKIERDMVATIVHDGLGNSLDEEPSHIRSGILTQLLGMKERPLGRRIVREAKVLRTISRETFEPKKILQPLMASDGRLVEEPSLSSKELTKLSGAEYMAHLSSEFSRILSARAGMPFLFSMKPLSDTEIDEVSEQASLVTIEDLLAKILSAAKISAAVSFSQYRTSNHRFAVFFVAPTERDPQKNKDLISALRQILKLHAATFSPGQVNVLLVLANARHVIEEHLYKLGAKKIAF